MRTARLQNETLQKMDVPGAVVSTPVKRPPSSDDGARVCESPIAALATTTTIGGGGVVKGTPVKRGTVAPARTIRAPHDANARDALVFATEKECETHARARSPFASSATHQDGVTCDPFVARKLRAHQREGARWMYRALHGMDATATTTSGREGVRGVLLADEMGLGKSLQVLAVLWTMLTQGPRGKPTCRRAVLICPASLIGNWGAEFKKWLGDIRVQASLAEGNAEAVDRACDRWCAEPREDSKSSFDRWPVLVMSYETARRLGPRVAAMKPDLLVCDEAHRLRNAMGSQTMSALREINAPMRVLLTGTPIQNNLNEYASVLDFAQPGLLESLEDFQRDFTQPIQRQYERGASKSEIELGRKMAAELNRRTAGKILSRKSSTNAAYLPKKAELVILCQLTSAQRQVYEAGANLVESWTSVDKNRSSGAAALCAIGLLRQVANEVDQILQADVMQAMATVENELDAEVESDEFSRASASDTSAQELKKVMAKALPDDYSGGAAGSGKFTVLQHLLESLAERADTTERVVIVSGYSASLSTAENMCKKLNLSTSRLDGTVAVDLRTSIVKDFNSGHGGRVMLLSVVAGGAGLNLVGANRLILMDVSWNPAHDRQAMGRIWRDGQRKPVTIYRLIAAGTVEQKVFERQLGKEVLKSTVESGYVGYEGDGFTTKDSLEGIVKFTGDDLDSKVDWGRSVATAGACPLLDDAHKQLKEMTFRVVNVSDETQTAKDSSQQSRKESMEARIKKSAPERRALEDVFRSTKKVKK